MKKYSLIALVLVAYVLSVGAVVKNHMSSYKVGKEVAEMSHKESWKFSEISISDLEILHEKRFHEFMEKCGVEYTDAGCEFGWEMTGDPYIAKYTLKEAMIMCDTIPQDIYNAFFARFNED